MSTEFISVVLVDPWSIC